jgi:transposase
MKPLPVELRRRIWVFHDSTRASVEETAKRFSVGTATVKRILANLRKTGSLEGKEPSGGPPKSIPDEKLDVIAAILAMNRDITLAELADRWFDRTGEQLSPTTMCRAVKRAGFTLKKSRSAPAGGSSRTSKSVEPRSPSRSTVGSSKTSSTSTSAA